MSILSIFSFFLIFYISWTYLRYYVPLKSAYSSGNVERIVSIVFAGVDLYILLRLIFLQDPGFVTSTMVSEILSDYQIDPEHYVEMELPQLLTEQYFKRQGLII